MKPVIYFDEAYLERCKSLTTEQCLIFIDAFQRMQTKPSNKITLSTIPQPRWVALNRVLLLKKPVLSPSPYSYHSKAT